MPDISQINMLQWCVVWRRSDTKTKHGQARVLSPINVKCRWITDEQETVSQESSREAYPHSMQVNQQIPLGSYVWGPGRITDLPSSPQYWEVIATQKVPDLKNRHPVYRVSLQKASKTLPTLV